MQKTTKKVIVIAVDGEPAAGKGTLAKGIAKHFNMLYMDTGAMFRTFGLYFVINNIELTNNNIEKYVNDIDVNLKYEDTGVLAYLNGLDVTDKIRTTEVTNAAKIVSKNKLVRDKMIQMQRKIALSTNSVVDGQDIGTVVFPNADVKIFLKANLDERAKRRKIDFDKKGENITFEKVKNDIYQRTKEDYERTIAPLKMAEDAFLIDNSNLSKEETLEVAINEIKKRIEI